MQVVVDVFGYEWMGIAVVIVLSFAAAGRVSILAGSMFDKMFH